MNRTASAFQQIQVTPSHFEQGDLVAFHQVVEGWQLSSPVYDREQHVGRQLINDLRSSLGLWEHPHVNVSRIRQCRLKECEWQETWCVETSWVPEVRKRESRKSWQFCCLNGWVIKALFYILGVIKDSDCYFESGGLGRQFCYTYFGRHHVRIRKYSPKLWAFSHLCFTVLFNFFGKRHNATDYFYKFLLIPGKIYCYTGSLLSYYSPFCTCVLHFLKDTSSPQCIPP